ncbi:MAG: Holliday junction resolvase RuvX [Hydrotalea sp.]|nr:Holliday junction resolvase RuvX [Hydrotalea sp.]
MTAIAQNIFSHITDQRKDFIATMPRVGRLLALDIGKKRTGLALSDPQRKIASQFGLLQQQMPHNGAKDSFSRQAEAIITMISNEQIVGLVIGLPRNMDGGENKSTQSRRQYARNLAKAGVTIPILLLDERLTSQAVDKLLADDKAFGDNLTTAKKNKLRDQMAASFLLQGLLDQMNPLINPLMKRPL